MSGRHQPTAGADSEEALTEAQLHETPESDIKGIKLEANWENMAAWFARALAENAFGEGRDPVISFIEQIRYLTQTNPDAVERILEDLRGDAVARDYHS